MNTPTPQTDELAAVIHMLRWVASQGDRQLGQDCAVVMAENYQHLKREAWQQLNPMEKRVLRQLMADAPQAA